MQYSPDLIRITDEITVSSTMFALYLVNAEALSLNLSGVRCYLNGCHLLCLNTTDTVTIHGGQYEARGLCFRPDFYNIGLNHLVIEDDGYEDLRARCSFPDFHLFLKRDDTYCGILPLSADIYTSLRNRYTLAERFVDAHDVDPMWSCHARSQLISVMCLAESAFAGQKEGSAGAVIQYIREHVERPMSVESLCQMFKTNRTTLTKMIRASTGMAPMEYVMEERLNQSCPDLLFTALPIGDVALKYGFSGANYYIRAFKRRFGKSPLQYRNDGLERLRQHDKEMQ
ncbi:MAG: helix-turn-helix transcriptional regulator [Ruminococcaceae bacterium]|nr:helix-turn-helix transcriptional regulator [Oscillospiraceae bacterium]